ncbi:hypothetical protein FKM82_005928 [Ascaphus truei]
MPVLLFMRTHWRLRTFIRRMEYLFNGFHSSVMLKSCPGRAKKHLFFSSHVLIILSAKFRHFFPRGFQYHLLDLLMPSVLAN